MVKKFSLLLAAAALLAFAVPAFANAAAVTQPAGTLLATGSTIVGTSTNAVIETELGELSCASATIEANLTENTGSSIMASSIGEGGASGCELEGEFPITITHLSWPTLTATSLTKTISVTFLVDFPFGVQCTFSGTGAFTNVAGGASVHLSGTLSGGACGTATIRVDFSLKHSGSAVILD